MTLSWKFAEQRKIMSCMMSNILCNIICVSTVLKFLSCHKKYKVKCLGFCILEKKYTFKLTQHKYVRRKFETHETKSSHFCAFHINGLSQSRKMTLKCSVATIYSIIKGRNTSSFLETKLCRPTLP